MINTTYIRHALALCGASLLFAGTAQAMPALDPLMTGGAPTTGGQGLAGTWYKVNDEARFSNYKWSEAGAAPTEIKNFGWGTGIWSTMDIADIAAGKNPAVTATAKTVSAVSFANNLYNETYGQSPWRADGVRPIAPIVNAVGGGETNYAAVFTGWRSHRQPTHTNALHPARSHPSGRVLLHHRLDQTCAAYLWQGVHRLGCDGLLSTCGTT